MLRLESSDSLQKPSGPGVLDLLESSTTSNTVGPDCVNGVYNHLPLARGTIGLHAKTFLTRALVGTLWQIRDLAGSQTTILIPQWNSGRKLQFSRMHVRIRSPQSLEAERLFYAEAIGLTEVSFRAKDVVQHTTYHAIEQYLETNGSY